MTAHIIYDNEIKSCQEAAGNLFSQEGKVQDPRSLYQQIFHILEGCKDRFTSAPNDEKEEYQRAVSTIARYIVNGAVKIPSQRREQYLALAKEEVRRGVLNEIREEMAKR
jgi:hypothetical protein